MDRRSSGRLGGLATRARHDSRKTTEAARRARWQRFLDAADPDGVLPAEERIARAEAARRAVMIRLSARGVAARKRA